MQGVQGVGTDFEDHQIVLQFCKLAYQSRPLCTVSGFLGREPLHWRQASFSVAVLAALLTGSGAAAHAQGRISGCVTDAFGAPVPVVETVRQDDRAFGVIRSITLDRKGPGPSLYELWNHADAVLHLRVEQSLGAAPWALGGNKTGRIVSIEYRAAVIETLKSHALGGPTDRALAFLQTGAGEWRDQNGRAYRTSAGPPEELYSVGEELIAFLRWDAPVERFWRTMVFRIRDGRVSSGEWGNNAIRQGTAVEGLLERLRAMGTRRGPESD